MQRNLSKVGHIFLVVAIILASGGHWAVLQSVAWARMLVVNAQRSTLVQAVEKTFDGRHPCHLCQSIAIEKAKEKKQPRVDAVSKIVLFHEKEAAAFWPRGQERWSDVAVMEYQEIGREPDSPPPRSGVV